MAGKRLDLGQKCIDSPDGIGWLGPRDSSASSACERLHLVKEHAHQAILFLNLFRIGSTLIAIAACTTLKNWS